MSQARVSLLMIVKDVERWLGRCLESVQGAVDELVVVDTGSTDRTVSIAENAGATVLHFPWTDSFAEALNHGLARCTGDYVLRLDGDEELLPQSVLEVRRIAARGERLLYQCMIASELTRNGNQEWVKSRMVRLWPRRGWQWFGDIHETLVSTEGEPPQFTPCGVEILHHGYADPEMEAQKQHRNLALLAGQREQHPELAILAHYQGISLQVLGRNAEAVEKFAEAIRLVNRHVLTHGLPVWALTTYAALGTSLLDMGCADASLAVTRQAYRYTANHAPLKLNEAAACRALGMHEAGMEAALEALVCTDDGEAADANAGGWKALLMAALCARELPDGGRAVLARRIRRETATAAPVERALMPGAEAR